MRYTDLIFDLYGTLVDVWTEEDDSTWEKTAEFFRRHGTDITGTRLKAEFEQALQKRERSASEGEYLEYRMEELFMELCAKILPQMPPDGFFVSAARCFRSASMRQLRCFDGALEALSALRDHGCRLWLFSNAQAVFTVPELKELGLSEAFDGIYLSSDFGFRKPDPRFYSALLNEQGLDVRRCLMIGNDRETDISGARGVGMDTLFLHTRQTPSDQPSADPDRSPRTESGLSEYELEGCDWPMLAERIPRL